MNKKCIVLIQSGTKQNENIISLISHKILKVIGVQNYQLFFLI